MSIQRNVQQQNDLVFESLLRVAKHFREHGVAPGIRKFLALKAIDIDTSAVISADDQDYHWDFDVGLEGTLVTIDKRFFRFELELNATATEVIAVHEFADVTSEQNLSEHNRGVGKSAGALAIAVMETLNA